LNIEKCDKLTLISKSSNITINDINSLNLNSKRDVLEIKNIDVLRGSVYFTKLTVYNFIKDMNIETKFGAVILEMISKAFDNIQLNSNYTDITLIFQNGSNFQFNLTQSELAFSYPTDKAVLTTNEINKEQKLFKTNGSFGAVIASSSTVNIKAVKGSLKIFFREKK